MKVAAALGAEKNSTQSFKFWQLAINGNRAFPIVFVDFLMISRRVTEALGIVIPPENGGGRVKKSNVASPHLGWVRLQ